MRLFQLNVTKTRANFGVPVKIPKGIIGAKVALWFSPEWEGLTKTVVFRAGEITKDILDVKDAAVIPAECTQEVGALLEIGVYGVDAENTVAIPTLWAALGTVYDGADPSGDPSTDPQLPVWAQLLKMYEELQDEAITEEQVKDLIDKAVTELPAHNGASAYEIAVEHGFEGTEEEWIASLKGEPGVDGKDGYTPIKGVDYFDGINGKDGYTPKKGIDYFDGKNGIDGKDGYTPIKGVDYFDGKDGVDGYTPVKGVDYYTEVEKTELVNEVLEAIPTESIYGTTPIFETTTSEAVELLEINQKADGTPFRLKSVLVFVETIETGSTMYLRGMLNSGEKIAIPIGSPKANSYAMAEFYISRGKWDGWRQAFDANKYNSAYRYGMSFAAKQVDVENVPWLDAVRITNIPANTKVILYGVEENA